MIARQYSCSHRILTGEGGCLYPVLLWLQLGTAKEEGGGRSLVPGFSMVAIGNGKRGEGGGADACTRF